MPSEQPGVPQPHPGVGRRGRHRPVEEQIVHADAGAHAAAVVPATGRHGTPEALGARPSPAPRPGPVPQPAPRSPGPGPVDPPTEPLDPVASDADARNGAARPSGATRTHRARAEDPAPDAAAGEDIGTRRTGRRRAVSGTGTHRTNPAGATGTHRIRPPGGGHRVGPAAEDSGHYDAYSYDSETGGPVPPPPAAPARPPDAGAELP